MVYGVGFTVRSGSTVLCDHLRASGFGSPTEHFHTSEEDFLYYERVGLERAKPLDYVREVVRQNTVNQVFGTKLVWDNKNTLYHVARSDPNLVGLFAKAKWIYVQRRDKISQAVSAWKAEQTGQWTSLDKAKIDEPPEYDFLRIAELLHSYCMEDFAWSDWFARTNVAPFVVNYEEYIVDRERILPKLVRHLVEGTKLDPESFQIKFVSEYGIQRDAHSDDIKKKFVSDLDRRGIPLRVYQTIGR
jgi:trehalose 2-sulfotransferase